MPIVKRSHRRHQTNSSVLVAPDFADHGAHALAAIYDFHKIKGQWLVVSGQLQLQLH